MPPRKSLPAPRTAIERPAPRRGQSSTPRKAAPQAETVSRKRQRRAELEDDLESIEAEPEAPVTRQANGIKAEEPAVNAGMDPEKELEHWQDFAVEHYEMVEQLPLELHRNYRLLRELDDGVAIHAEKLQNAIREYIAYRLGETIKPAEPVKTSSPTPIPPLPSLTLDGGAGPVDANGNVPASVMDLGVPVSDGQGGEVMPAPATEAEAGDIEMAVEAEGAVVAQDLPADEPRLAFPTKSPTLPEADVVPFQAIKEDLQEVASESKKINKGWTLLPEIARLAKEMVKNGEEKVAVAQGAYNSIDRHIRALDSALSAQEASILLGLRPSTMPSTAVEIGLENGETGALVDVDEDTIGTGGGGERRKGRGARGRGRGRGGARGGGRAGEAITTLAAEAAVIPPQITDADPNEPRYCYCNQVSYGEMMACDNDDCPIEWFHIACAGFTAAPSGNWLCNVCNPSPTEGKVVGTPAGRGTNKGTRGRGRGRQTR